MLKAFFAQHFKGRIEIARKGLELYQYILVGHAFAQFVVGIQLFPVLLLDDIQDSLNLFRSFHCSGIGQPGSIIEVAHDKHMMTNHGSIQSIQVLGSNLGTPENIFQVFVSGFVVFLTLVCRQVSRQEGNACISNGKGANDAPLVGQYVTDSSVFGLDCNPHG